MYIGLSSINFTACGRFAVEGFSIKESSSTYVQPKHFLIKRPALNWCRNAMASIGINLDVALKATIRSKIRARVKWKKTITCRFSAIGLRKSFKSKASERLAFLVRTVFF